MDVEDPPGDEEPNEPGPTDSVEKHAFVLKLNRCSLAGHINDNDCAEWDWGYIPAAVGMSSSKEFRYLKQNGEEFQAEFQKAQISFDEFHYRGREPQCKESEKGGHSMESRGLILMLSLLPQRRQVRSEVKAAAMSLLASVIAAMLGMVGATLRFTATIFGTDWEYHSQLLLFENGSTEGLGALFGHHSLAQSLWEKLGQKAWHGLRVVWLD